MLDLPLFIYSSQNNKTSHNSQQFISRLYNSILILKYKFKMKDRWKILITSISVGLLIALIVGCISASFKIVELRSYGILYHELFYYSQNQSVRTNGNYLVGIDSRFVTFPRGIISQQFSTMALTKDKSMIQINGFFAGRLIKDQIMGMFEIYGYEYQEFLQSSVQQFTRQAIQYYTLSEVIGNRVAVDNNVRGFVCLKLQMMYSWIHCDYVSLGRIGGNIPRPLILPVETSFEEKLLEILGKHIQAQKKKNILSSGGADFLQTLQTLNANMFANLTTTIANALNNNQNKADSFKYYISSPNYPPIDIEYEMEI